MSASPSKWKQRSPYRHERSDGAVVKYDSTTLCSTSKPWLAGHRGYIAFGPGAGDFSCLSYRKRGGRFRIPSKFRSAESAMRAVDKRFPLTTQPMKDKAARDSAKGALWQDMNFRIVNTKTKQVIEL